ncbi:hypothetical protein [Globicatella sanguinis]
MEKKSGKKNKFISIYCDYTGRNPGYDEIIRLVLMNNRKEILFNNKFKPVSRTTWQARENNHYLYPEDVKEAKTLLFYKTEIEEILKDTDIIIGNQIRYLILPFFEYHGIKIPNDIEIIDIKQLFDEYYREVYDKFGYIARLSHAAEKVGLTSISDWDDLKESRINIEMFNYLTIQFENIIHEEAEKGLLSVKDFKTNEDDTYSGIFGLFLIFLIIFFILSLF